MARSGRAQAESRAAALCYNPALMMALTRQLSPRLFPWRRAADLLTPHSALLICALFLLAGVFLSGDYGIGFDEQQRRQNAVANLNYILGNADIADLPPYPDRFFGVSFELPLLLAERALGLEDYYDVHRLRLILTHLFFIAGGFCCYLLVYRLFNNRLLALLALLLFLLHPRLYAHSYVNSKDLPLLSMFSIALYLLERAWRRDTAGAFVMLGLAVGVLTDLRIMGIILFPAVLAMRGLDLWRAKEWARRRHILLTGGLFAVAAGLVPLALSPYAWSNPLDYLTGALTLTVNHPLVVPQLFQEQRILSTELPPHYALTWFAITTPPPILLLGFIGAAAVIRQCLTRPEAVFGNTWLRFGVLLLACFALPLLGVVLLGSNIFDDWRHLYFIYAPFCLLAVLGSRWLAAALRRQWWLKAGMYGLVGAGLGLVILQMAQIHPQQQVYFNFLVDRTTPEHLRTRYEMDYWRLAGRQVLEYLLNRHPGETVYVRGGQPWPLAAEILPAAARQRLVFNSTAVDPDYILADAANESVSRIYAHRVYNNTLLSVNGVDTARMDATAANYYRESYQAAIAREPIIRADYAVYRNGRTLTLVRENCPPGALAGRFSAKVYQENAENQPVGWLDLADFRALSSYGVRLGDKCLAVLTLPDYPIAQILAGQGYVDAAGGERLIWEEGYRAARPGLGERAAALLANTPGPAVDAYFDLYRQGNALVYHREPCAPADTWQRFFLHIVPADPADLPAARRPHGFVNRDFDFARRGWHTGGECLAVIPLPDYPIAAIRTGQFAPGAGNVWTAELPAVR